MNKKIVFFLITLFSIVIFLTLLFLNYEKPYSRYIIDESSYDNIISTRNLAEKPLIEDIYFNRKCSPI